MAQKQKLVLDSYSGTSRLSKAGNIPTKAETVSSIMNDKVLSIQSLIDSLTLAGMQRVDTIPTSSTQAGTRNTFSIDNNYLYIWVGDTTVRKLRILEVENSLNDLLFDASTLTAGDFIVVDTIETQKYFVIKTKEEVKELLDVVSNNELADFLLKGEADFNTSTLEVDLELLPINIDLEV